MIAKSWNNPVGCSSKTFAAIQEPIVDDRPVIFIAGAGLRTLKLINSTLGLDFQKLEC